MSYSSLNLHHNNSCFQTVVWRRLLKVPWAARSNHSILKEINPEYSLEGLMLKLKLQYFGHLMQRADSSERPWCWERLKAGEEGDDRGQDDRMASLTQWTWVWASSRRWWRRGKPGSAAVHGVPKSQTWLNDWATTTATHTLACVPSFPRHYESVFFKVGW